MILYEEVKGMTTKELVEKYRSEKDRYMRLKFNHAVSPLDQPHTIKIVRRNIARFLMEINDRRKASEVAALTQKEVK